MKYNGYDMVSFGIATVAFYMLITGKPDWGWLILFAIIVWTFPNVQKNKKAKANKETIKLLEGKLIRYREELAKNPDSTFHKGVVKNTEEFIQELKEGKL